MTAEEIKALLGLEPHPVEGGWYRRTYTSAGNLELPRGVRRNGHGDLLPARRGNLLGDAPGSLPTRSSTSILGDPVEMLLLYPDERGSAVLTFGPDLQAGQQPQILVPAGVWQGDAARGRRKVALLAAPSRRASISPITESGSYAELAANWPAEAERIRKLTRRVAELAGLASCVAELAPVAEEIAQQFRGFFRANSLLHLHLVVELRVVEHREHRAAGAGLGIGGGEDQAVEAGVNHGSGAHGAGFERDVERAAREPIVAERRGRRAQGDDFRVGCGIDIAQARNSARGR